VGGVGKTPLVAALARQARERNLSVALVTRGYASVKRPSGVILASADGSNLETAGDEAIMLSQELGLPVYVAPLPESAIEALGLDAAIDLVILDDGVRRRWEGERRVLVISEGDLLRPIEYLPAGRWRIPPRYASHSQGIAIIQSSARAIPVAEPPYQNHLAILKQWGFELPTAWFRTVHAGFSQYDGQSLASVAALPDNEPLVFCGLGQPSRFEEHLHALGIEPRGFLQFPDHHRYDQREWRLIEDTARTRGASAILTTHKDAVKVKREWLGTMPLYVLRITLELTHGADMLSVILEPTE
jgi:tetraacyldisaccharide 4'-kinase